VTEGVRPGTLALLLVGVMLCGQVSCLCIFFVGTFELGDISRFLSHGMYFF